MEDKLLEFYLDELGMLFMHHGRAIPLGETTKHVEATESQLESIAYLYTYIDEEDGCYHIVHDIIDILQPDDIKEYMGDLLGAFGDPKAVDNFNKNFDEQINDNGTYEERQQVDYFGYGWPYHVVNQRINMLGNVGRIIQTEISLDSISFGNP